MLTGSVLVPQAPLSRDHKYVHQGRPDTPVVGEVAFAKMQCLAHITSRPVLQLR